MKKKNFNDIFLKYAEDVKQSSCKTKSNGGYSAGVHLFPFRTEKLSPVAPMVLPSKVGE